MVSYGTGENLLPTNKCGDVGEMDANEPGNSSRRLSHTLGDDHIA